MSSRAFWLLLVLPCACSLDLIEPGSGSGGGGEAGQSNTGGFDPPTTSTGLGGAAGGGDVTGGTGEGGTAGAGGTGGTGGGPPVCNHVATFDGEDDALTYLPPNAGMTSANAFAFSIWIAPDPEAHGQLFVAGRSQENQRLGWNLLMIENGSEWTVRFRVHSGFAMPCYVDAHVPKALFPLRVHARAYEGGYLTMSIDDDPVAEYQCSVRSYSTVTSNNAPFRVGTNEQLDAYNPFRGNLDDLYWSPAPETTSVCMSPGQIGYGWDFETVGGEQVLPAAGCMGALWLGLDGTIESEDPIISCIAP